MQGLGFRGLGVSGLWGLGFKDGVGLEGYQAPHPFHDSKAHACIQSSTFGRLEANPG